jgi:hypothetical protein
VAEAGQGEGLVLGRAVVPGQLQQGLGGGRVEAAGELGVAQLDPPAVAEGPVELAAGPVQQPGGLGVVAGDQGVLGQGELGVKAGVGAGGGRAEQVDGAVRNQGAGPARPSPRRLPRLPSRPVRRPSWETARPARLAGLSFWRR